MLENFGADTMVFAVSGKLDIIRHVLNSCDYYLDVVPADSIFIEPDRLSVGKPLDKNDDEYGMLMNSLTIFLWWIAKKSKCWIVILIRKQINCLAFHFL